MIGESFARIVLGHVRRFSFSKQDQHHRMLILGINFCPCKNSLIENLFCTYCHYVRKKSSKLHETDIFSLALRSIKSASTSRVSPTNTWNAVDWSVVEGLITFIYVHQFCWLFTKHSQAGCEHLNRAVAGRSRFNCLCEGLIVFLFFQNSIQKYMFTSCLKNR